ncbi:MAG: UDP-N-acetylmuramoyl-tripeptide--D-alanyl-D-alanine ligase [Saprospiraceae bacterium]|nr:UDP-N-acetylmuramoyl-tripeptide--D-alanyl-D-alanine ligase [Saprospiraceae bacterium]
MTLDHLYAIFQQHPRCCTDSRMVQRGDIFFALRGDNFDGNQYAAKALEAGATYVVVDDPLVYREGDARYLLVDNVLLTLQDLARFHRRKFDIPVIAIGGSNGKTTTKELVSAVLRNHYPMYATPGNLNNHIGVPLTLLHIPPKTEVAVVEMGANHQGEMAFLCRIAEPTHGLLTNIGKEHLEGFGSIEGVRQAESELYRYLAAGNGMAFINRDEPDLEQLARPVTKKLLYGHVPVLNPDQKRLYEMSLLTAQPFLSVAFWSDNGELITAHTRLLGHYNLGNIMTAIALGQYFKVPALKIKEALEQYVPANNRSQLLEKGGNTYIMDAYNANPSSMEKAILSFAAMEGHPKIAVLGDMLELGEASEHEHDYIARLALNQRIDELLLIGKDFAKVADELGVRHFADSDALAYWWREHSPKGALVLVKGSRGIRLERMMDVGC